MAESRLANELIGAGVTVFASFLPFSPVFGGAVTGYLEASSSRRVEVDVETGAWIGAASGLIASLPLAFMVFVLVGVVSFLMGSGFGWLPGVSTAFLGLFVLFYVVSIVVYTVLLGALGGALGVLVAKEV